MVIGLCGMSFYSSPHSNTGTEEYEKIQTQANDLDINPSPDNTNENDLDNTLISNTIHSGQSNQRMRYYLGLASAIFNGVWGGSIMVPMHYSG